jgi:hypothetical protein
MLRTVGFDRHAPLRTYWRERCASLPGRFLKVNATQLAAFCKELNRKRRGRSLLHEVHVTVPLQEFKITHPVKIILGAQFHFRVLDDRG